MNRRRFLRGAVGGRGAAWIGIGSGVALTSQSPSGAPHGDLQIDRDELVALASDLARIQSFTAEDTECARFVRDYLEREGFECELQEVDPGRREGSDDYLTVSIDEMHACSQAYAATLAEVCA